MKDKKYIICPIEDSTKYIDMTPQGNLTTMRVSVQPYLNNRVYTYFCILVLNGENVTQDIRTNFTLLDKNGVLRETNSPNWSSQLAVNIIDPIDTASKFLREGDINRSKLNEAEIVYYINVFYAIAILYIKFFISKKLKPKLLDYVEAGKEKEFSDLINSIKKAFHGQKDRVSIKQMIVLNKRHEIFNEHVFKLFKDFIEFRNRIMHYSNFKDIKNPLLLDDFNNIVNKNFLNTLVGLQGGIDF